MPKGCSEVRHHHKHSEQFFYVLSGVATIEVNGVMHKLTEQQGVHVPAGIAHQLSNQHQADLDFVVTSTPPSHGDRFQTTIEST